jgi:hypothetical protein
MALARRPTRLIGKNPARAPLSARRLSRTRPKGPRWANRWQTVIADPQAVGDDQTTPNSA